MTEQEAYDIAYDHMLNTLKERSTGILGTCVYNGNMCAVGCLMTEEELEEFGDSRQSAFGLMGTVKERFPESELLDLDRYFLDELQNIHDEKDSWDEDGFSPKGKDRMRGLASDFKLEHNIPKRER